MQEEKDLQADVFLGVRLHGQPAEAAMRCHVPNRLFFESDTALQSHAALGDSLVKDRCARH